MVTKSGISKAKRNNQKKNKLIKHGVTQKNKKKKIGKPLLPVARTQKQNEESEESDYGEDMLQMVDEEDLDFLKTAITNRSYNILNKIRYSEFSGPKAKKRKPNDEIETLENQYEETITNGSSKKMKGLLPIKTKSGIVPQMIAQEQDKDENESENYIEDNNDTEATNNEEEISVQGPEFDFMQPISAAQLLAFRNEALRQKKIHIGTLSSGLLESPEEKVMNLKTLLTIMDEETPEIYYTLRKLVIVSLLEVFKDILPSYEIKKIKNEGVKLKKDTLKLQKYEETLLVYYKKYLQKLEKFCFSMVKKKGDSRKRSEDEIKLSILAVQAMCDLLVAHPYFNFSQNVAQALIPFLNNHNKDVRQIVKTAVQTIFKEDKKGETTLKILRIINNYLKNHMHNTHVDILEVLLVLNLRGVNLDQEKEHDIKQKKLKSHKSRILQLSKKERKRKKKLQEVEKELLETKAEESKQVKQKNLAEITTIVFNIYFRILKNSTNTKVLGVCLEGLAKFAHCINFDFYMDLVNVLDNLLNEEWLSHREQLHCVQTVFAILSGQGEVLNLDPLRFYNRLYTYMLTLNIASGEGDHVLDLIKTLGDALMKRRKKITNKRMLGFVKRLATVSLQMSHDGSLGCLGLVRNIMQLNRNIDILLDLDSTVGEGKFDAEIDDPEYSHASSTALYEVLLLARHYHPIVNKLAKNIAHGVPTTGEGTLQGEYGKWNAEELYNEFNMSEMAFNPPVPIPKRVQPKSKPNRTYFLDQSFHEECKAILRKPKDFKFWIHV